MTVIVLIKARAKVDIFGEKSHVLDKRFWDTQTNLINQLIWNENVSLTDKSPSGDKHGKKEIEHRPHHHCRLIQKSEYCCSAAEVLMSTGEVVNPPDCMAAQVLIWVQHLRWHWRTG